MTETAKPQPIFHINQVGTINTGDVTIQGDQIGSQINHVNAPEIKGAMVYDRPEVIADLRTLITTLQTQHPTVTSESQALTIIDAEFTEIKHHTTHKLATLRRQILNPDRHLQATKATLSEVAKHYLEESVFAKAIVTYIDKLSETPDQGA
jgi:hypothetical protein